MTLIGLGLWVLILGPISTSTGPPLLFSRQPFEKRTSETEVVGTGGVRWRARFDLEADNADVGVTLCVRLIPGAGVERGDLTRRAREWEKGVEALLDGQFLFEGGPAPPIPIRFNLLFSGCRYPHHEVIVRSGRGGSDTLHWNLEDPITVVAHEVGHMLGAYDEYLGGALNPATQEVAPTSLMSTEDSREGFAPRHLKLLCEVYTARSGAGPVSIKPARGSR